MIHEELLHRVEELAAFATDDEAERALAATLVTLGECLADNESRALAGELPPPAAQALRRAAFTGGCDVSEFYDRVARREGVAIGFGVEHAQAVCRAVGEGISEEALVRLRKELTPDVSALFDTPERDTVPEHVPHIAGHSLSEGRPGSRHPVSEANDPLAHTHSVVRASNPHGDTKVSSAHGLTQEQLGETLAEGHPGSSRPIAKTRH
jgi:uncharacterized protein (DUF2267 family)